MTRHVPLRSLLALHERHQDATPLPENLGDGVLYEHNAVFRSVRDGAVAAGCTFTTDDPSGYLAWPLVALPELLQTRVIPYRRTRPAFARLEASRPGFFKTSDAELIEPPSNAVLHEGAHCVADAAWRELGPAAPGIGEPQRLVLRHALAESFANATELAAMAHTASPEEEWLLAYNSYWAPLPKFPAAWQRLSETIGGVAAARWLILGFLAANLLREQIGGRERTLMLELAGVPPAAGRAVNADLSYLSEEALSLNLVFRRNTARVFYASIGLSQPLTKLMSFSPEAVIGADPALQQLLERLAARIAG